MVVLSVCWLCVVPRRWWVRWQGLVVVVHVIVWYGEVCPVGWVARGARLRWGVVMVQLVGVAVVWGHRGVGVGRDAAGVVVLVVPRSWLCVNGGPGMAWTCVGGGCWLDCPVRVLRYGGAGRRWWERCCWCAPGVWA